MATGENSHLLDKQGARHWSGGDEDASSFSSRSSYSRSDSGSSYIPDWDPYISNDGQLFYVEMGQMGGSVDRGRESLPQLPPSLTTTFKGDLNRLSSARRSSNRGNSGMSKLSKLITTRSTKKEKQQAKEEGASSSNKSTFPLNNPCGEVTIKLVVDPAQRFKYGRRTSLSESLLGLSTTAFPDGQRIMITGFPAMSHPDLHQIIKVGDWLKAIEDTEVNMNNLDAFLMAIENITEVVVVVQRLSTAGECKFGNVSAIVKSLDLLMPLEEVTPAGQEEEETTTRDQSMVFTLMYLSMAETTEGGPEGQDILFCYPSKNLTDLYNTRGSFLTLNSLAREGLNTIPVTSSIEINGRTFHVVYTGFNQDDLLLITFREDILSIHESVLKSREIQRFLEFCFRTVSDAFKSEHSNQLKDVCKIIERRLKQAKQKPLFFHNSLLEAHWIPLPKEAQLRIDDALSEMEAMDYREWNDDPIKSHREFFIIGSALFYDGYLLASHLPVDDLIDVNAYLRTMGIDGLMENAGMREMIVWREVYVKSCERGLIKDDRMYGIPQGRWFLNIVGKGDLLLAILLESRYTDHKYQYINPAPFYIEEGQDTVEHLRSGGIENLTATWLVANKRPQCVLSTDKASLNHSSTSAASSSKKSDALLPFLKRRSSSSENLNDPGSSITSRTPSEDSHNKYDDNGDEGSDDGSDWDGFPGSHKSGSGFDVSEMKQALREVGDIQPSKLTAGMDNLLFQYCQLEVGEGLLMAPTVAVNPIILEAFRKAAHGIHEVLQRTLRFRQQLAQENDKPEAHRSSVAIKEHGVLISAPISESETMEFWVIGRLFLATGRETYLCHRADAPQNMVEIAYRLQLYATG